MNDEKLVIDFEYYLSVLLFEGAEPKELPEELKLKKICEIPLSIMFSHLAFMCEGAIAFVYEGRRDKAFRRLGFVQGSLYALNLCTIDDLKNPSRPDTEGA